jgi:hypothetical protein
MDCAEKARFIDGQLSKVKADTLGNIQFFFMIKENNSAPPLEMLSPLPLTLNWQKMIPNSHKGMS